MGVEIFLYAWLLWFLLILLSVIEGIGKHLFIPLFFNIGVPVVRKNIQVAQINSEIYGNKIIMPEGKFYFTKNKKVLFTQRIKMFEFRFRSQSPLKVVGEISDNNLIKATVRIPLVGTVAILLWIIGWIIVSINFALESIYILSLIFGLMATVFPIIITIKDYYLNKKYLTVMIDELKDICSGSVGKA